VTDVREISNELPTGFALAQNYPNPFNPTTSIQFSLPAAANVTLKIYNVLGQEVATLVNEQRGVGTFEAVWNGRNSAGNQMASGMYFYNLIATSTDGKNTFTNVKKMLLLK
jgi:flagellar hook assembly protein FlgD